jgi:aspartate racemase
MKKIGIIGGMGPEATIDYYTEIINAFKNEEGDLNYPEIIIYSVNLSEFISLMKGKKYDQATTLLLEKIDGLKRAGAEFAVLSANTPHLLFDRIKEKCGIPMISIVEAACNESIKIGYKRAGLIGTGFTMEASFFPDVFKKQGIDVIIPDKKDCDLINHWLFTEIELGIFKDDTRQMLIAIIEKMVQKQHIDSMILGCTEFPLILKESFYAGIPMLNTTKVHVDAIVKYCVE